MNVARTLGLVAVLAMLTGTSAAQAGSKPVIELFTSQGCNSCPPADALFGRLADNPGLIPLTLSVDYWDYLGWRDTLALNAHTKRQRGYSRTRGDMNVYTPQAIVNGGDFTIGSDQRQIDAAIRKVNTASTHGVPVKLQRNGDTLAVEVGNGDGSAQIWLLSVTHKVRVPIARGENKGETIVYTNVVRSWRNLGNFDGKPVKLNIPVSEIVKNEADTVVVLVQAGSENAPGAIRGAEILSLR